MSRQEEIGILRNQKSWVRKKVRVERQNHCTPSTRYFLIVGNRILTAGKVCLVKEGKKVKYSRKKISIINRAVLSRTVYSLFWLSSICMTLILKCTWLFLKKKYCYKCCPLVPYTNYSYNECLSWDFYCCEETS